MAEDITGILIETDDILGTVDDINVTGAVYEQVSLVTYVDTAVSDVLSGDFTPTSLTTSGKKFAILLTYAGTLPFGGVFEIWASDSNDRTVATHVDDSSALTYLHSGLDLVDTKYYWIRVRDMYGAHSAWYPSSATAGVSGTTSTDASDYLDLLIGNISEDQLVDELKTRINLIDRDYIYEEGVFEQSDPFDPFTMVFAGIDKLIDALISDNATNISDINDLISTTLTHAAEIAAIESEITSLTTSEWQNDQSYTVGRYVVYNDTVYRCTQAYTYPPAKEPGVDTDYWEEADSIVTLVSDVESRVDVLEGTITDKVGSTEFNALENRVTVNEAAITVNSADILLRVEQSDFDAFSVLVFPEYDSGDTYVINDIVQHDGKTYKCILTIDFSPAPDPSNATYWEEVDFTHEFQTAVSQIDVNADNITLSSSAIVGDVTYLFALEADRSYETGVYVETVGDIDGLDLILTQANIDIDGAEANIVLHASQISGLDSRLSQAEIDIDGVEASIALKASQSSLDSTNANVTAAGIRLDGHDASISAQAIQISTLESTTGTHTTQISQAQADINAAEAAILLRATKAEIDGTLAPEWSAVVTYTAGEQVRYYSTQYDLYKCILTSPAGTLPTNDTYWTKLGLIGGRVSQAEADIDAAEASILLKASQVDLSALTSRVSNAEIDIDGAQASILLHTSQISTLQDTTGTHTAQIAQAQIDINTAESNIADGQAGTWSSISSKATTATVNALDTRVGTAETNITSLQAADGTLQSNIDAKVAITTYNTGISGLQTQIDGKIETYYTDTDPNTWASGDRTKHTGDMWYAPTTHLLKRYDGTLNSWSTIEDQKAIDAYTNAARAQDTADGKRRVFVTTPTTPYDVGDLWSGGSSGDLKRCKTQRLTGAYQAGDWELACKYTDDSSLTTFISTYNNDQKVGGVLRISTAESNISTLQSNMSTAQSDITDRVTVATYNADQKVDGVLRIAAAESTLSAQGGDITNIKAQYTLKLNVNDRVAGFGLMLSDDEPSEFAIVADRFIIVDPDIDGNESVPFIVGDIGGVHTVGINGNLIVDGSILAQSIGANEIVTSAANIKDLAVTNAKIKDINASKINAGYISADRIQAGTLTGAKISAATTITAGSGNNVAVLTGDDATYRIFAGHAVPGSAPFRVKKSGEIYCSSGKVEGSFKVGGVLSNNSLFRVGWMQDRGTISGGPGSYSFSDYQRSLSGFFVANSTYIITELYYQFFKSGGYSSSSTDSITFWLTYNGVALCTFSGSLSPAQYDSAWYNGLVGLYGVNSTPAQNSIFSPIITKSTTALVEHLSASGASGGGGMVVGVRLRIAGFRIETNPFPSTGWGTGIWEG